MTSEVPTTMKAVVFIEDDRVLLKEHPVPTNVADHEVLVKNVTIALNPADWKHIDYKLGKRGSVLGCDFSGIVVKAGKYVTNGVKVGDHVAGVSHGYTYPDKGAFAEYVKADSELVWVVPENTFTHEQAATYCVAFWTSVQACYNPKNLGLVEPPNKVAKAEWVLIYGGSSACGLSAIQFAHLSGYKVITTASTRNHELLKSFGADITIDYREPDLVSKIKQATGDSIQYGLDTIGHDETERSTIQAIRPSGGKVIGLEPMRNQESDRTDVSFHHIVLYTMNGYPVTIGSRNIPAVPEDKAHMVAFLKKLSQLVRDGATKPLPIKFWEGGLGAIKDGMQYMREGKASGEKIVYRL